MNGSTFRSLEFEAIRSLLAAEAGSTAGREEILALEPATDPQTVRTAQALTAEGLSLLRSIGRQPYHDLPDLTSILPAARRVGDHLEPRALQDVASFIDGATEIGQRVSGAQAAPKLAFLAGEVSDARDLAEAIRRTVLPGGEVADDASPRLRELRRSLARLDLQLQSVMESYLHDRGAERVLQDKLITTRNDRYVLLLKAEQRGQLAGIVHGSSGSGASLYVEPLPAVELNNDIVARRDEERQEVVRILIALSARVGERAEDLSRAADVMGELDAVQARALLAVAMDAQAPQIAPAEQGLELIDARHPLLMSGLCERLGLPPRVRAEPVPVTVRMDQHERVLVISGPNTGGKTVALKTVGLLAMMAQCGLHIPAAAGSRLPVFRRIFADIGDEQSIAADLSTFSAHLAALAQMTGDMELPALVLLDEVGSGTDPTEGGALGVAVVEHFRKLGAFVAATTHHGEMKTYAQSTPGVACASFGYDPETYAPTYHLALGVPGRSLALEMGSRLGLPESIIADARSRLDVKQVQVEALLQQLEAERARLERDAQELRAQRRALDAAAQRRQQAEDALLESKRAALDEFVVDLRRRSAEAGRQAAETVERAVRNATLSRRSAERVKNRARREAARTIAEARSGFFENPQVTALLEPAPSSAGAALCAGTRVHVRSLGVRGEVSALHGAEVEVAVSGKRLRVPLSELTPLEGAAPPRTHPVNADFAPRPAAAEINLVGLTVDEALPQVDKLLDDAALAERREIRVIHGFGQGRLRRAVADLLGDHPHVAAFRTGAPREGGAGVTVVELKD